MSALQARTCAIAPTPASVFSSCAFAHSLAKILRSGRAAQRVRQKTEPRGQPRPPCAPRAGAQSSEPERAREKSEKSETADTRPPCSPPETRQGTKDERLTSSPPSSATASRERAHTRRKPSPWSWTERRRGPACGVRDRRGHSLSLRSLSGGLVQSHMGDQTRTDHGTYVLLLLHLPLHLPWIMHRQYTHMHVRSSASST